MEYGEVTTGVPLGITPGATAGLVEPKPVANSVRYSPILAGVKVAPWINPEAPIYAPLTASMAAIGLSCVSRRW